MNAVHLHLAVNHLPLAAVLFGAAILQWGCRRGGPQAKNIGLSVLLFGGAAALVAMLSGDSAEKLFTTLMPLDKSLVHRHEEAAEFAAWATMALGAFSGWLLWRHRHGEVPAGRGAAAVLFSVFCFGALAWASYLGGTIRHSEIQPDRREALKP